MGSLGESTFGDPLWAEASRVSVQNVSKMWLPRVPDGFGVSGAVSAPKGDKFRGFGLFWVTFCLFFYATFFFSFATGIWTLGCSKQGFCYNSVFGTRSDPFQERYLLKTVQKRVPKWDLSKFSEKSKFGTSFHG